MSLRMGSTLVCVVVGCTSGQDADPEDSFNAASKADAGGSSDAASNSDSGVSATTLCMRMCSHVYDGCNLGFSQDGVDVDQAECVVACNAGEFNGADICLETIPCTAQAIADCLSPQHRGDPTICANMCWHIYQDCHFTFGALGQTQCGVDCVNGAFDGAESCMLAVECKLSAVNLCLGIVDSCATGCETELDNCNGRNLRARTECASRGGSPSECFRAYPNRCDGYYTDCLSRC